MNLLAAWKKVLLFGLFGAVGCLAGWLVGEPYLWAAKEVMKSLGEKEAPSLISTPTSPEPPPPPTEFKQRLAEAGAKTGDVQISLIWFNTNDLDLHCVDPANYEIFWKKENRRSPTGGELDVDRNADCRNPTPEPVENIYWAKDTAPMGRYRVYLNFYKLCPRAPNETSYKINVLHGGERKEFSGTILREDTPDGGPKRLIYEFQLGPKVELFAPGQFELPPGAALKVPVAVRREYYKGKVTVKAENLPVGVTSDTITFEPGQSEGHVTLTATDAVATGNTKIKFVATGDGVTHSFDSDLVVPSSPFSAMGILSTGVWTALLAVGLCLSLVAGQNKYLGKPLFASGRVPLALVILGAVAAGFVSGSVGQALFFLLLSVGIAKLGLVLGWMLLGVLLGAGVSFFIPNLDGKKAALAGLCGGLLGGVAFWVMSYAADILGRWGGAALLGFCIGAMVAAVEAAFRRAWLEVRFSERESITVNLGPEPVKVGGDARACTVWARGAAPVALRYWIRDGKVYCEDVPTKRESVVADGDSRAAGNVSVRVRTGAEASPTRTGSSPPRAPREEPAMELPPPESPRPAKPQAASPPAPPKPARNDYDDGLPMPMAPPPAARPVAASILDADNFTPAARPAKPQAAPSPSPKPPAPKPPAPSVAKPVVPPAPKPPAPPSPARSAKAGDPDACPSCGRKVPGSPGQRYCMVCDRTF